jgi:hypothetical protein
MYASQVKRMFGGRFALRKEKRENMKTNQMKKELIAPCGANCMICMAYLRTKNHCNGCRNDDTNKAKSCIECKIKTCEHMNEQGIEFCFQCTNYPCKKIKHIDNRYRKNYSYSMIDSLHYLKVHGMKLHLKNETTKWICIDCGGVICVHRGFCIKCGKIYYPNIGNYRSLIK